MATKLKEQLSAQQKRSSEQNCLKFNSSPIKLRIPSNSTAKRVRLKALENEQAFLSNIC